jgi:CBS domain-containing protein
MRTVRDIMQKQVITIRSGSTALELAELLEDEGISGVPVLDSTNRVVGVVSRTDLVRYAARHPERPRADSFWDTLAATASEDDPEELYFLAPESAVMVLPSQALDTLALEDVTVDEIMTPVAFSVDPEMLIWELADFLVKGRIHRALVLEEGRLVGIATAFDVLRVVAGDAGG